MNNVLKTVNDAMAAAGINYEYQEWTSEPDYPYFVGEYQEIEPATEDGKQETSFLLTGFTRSSYAELETAKEKIAETFPAIGGHVAITEDGSAVAIFYAGALGNIPTGDAELKRIQINLNIKEWKVI